ncbi:MAG: J domain-containing protein [Deltaproteobacteria bacterium]|jgi:curved DNA-binding protein|nr:J domain-containing protein [Deltaproteobacteria bacterium]
MAVSYKDYYQVLGVERSASVEEIARAFKKLARRHHPDLNAGNAQSEEKFKEVNEAYEVLKDPEKRKLYDQLGHNWQHGQQFQGAPGFENMHFSFGGGGASGFSDFFEMIFGQAARGGGGAGGFGPDPFGAFSARQRRGRDAEAEFAIPLEDAVQGGRRTLSLSGPGGERTLEVNIPAGIREGAKLRLAGQGNPVPGGGAPGDLFLRIRFAPHPRFQVDGGNLLCDVPLAPWEAALGARVRVPTLEGEVELHVPAGTSSGRKFRLRGKGLGAKGGRGDLLACAQIVLPETATEREQKLWEELAVASDFRARKE